MAETIGEAIRQLQKLGQFDIVDFGMEINRDTEHRILHKFRETVILPIHAVTNNIDFIMCTGKKTVTTADNVRCNVVQWKELHLLESDEEIRNLYGISAWDYAKKFYNYDKNMQNMTLIKMKLEKEENNNE